MTELKVLGIETATRTGGVAMVEGDRVTAAVAVDQKQSHSRLTATMIEQVLALAGRTIADLDVVAVSIGPGSFTGVRIGLALAKGLCLAADKPLIGVSTLESLAWRAAREDHWIVPLFDARRGEAYTALFRSGPDMAIPPERLTQDARLDAGEWMAVIEETIRTASDAAPVLFAGDAQTSFAEGIQSAFGARARFAAPFVREPSAETIALLGARRRAADPTAGRDWELLEPEYAQGH